MSKITEFILCLVALSLVVWICFDINDKHQFIATSKQDQKQAVIVHNDISADSIAKIVVVAVKKSNDSSLHIIHKEITNLTYQNITLNEKYIRDRYIVDSLFSDTTGTDIPLSRDPRLIPLAR